MVGLLFSRLISSDLLLKD